MKNACKIMLTIFFCLSVAQAYSAGQYDMDGNPSWNIFRGDPGLTGAPSGRLPENLVLKNRFAVNDEITASPVINGNMMFIGTLAGRMISMDLRTGAQAWVFETNDSIEAPALVVPEENILVFGTIGGIVHAVDIATGRLRWKFATDGQIIGSANYFTDQASRKTVVVVGSYDNSLYFLDTATGRRISSVETSNYINTTPAIDNGRIAFGGCDARIHIVDAYRMKEIMEVDTGAYIAGSACISRGTVFVGNYEGTFLAADITTGQVRWRFQISGDGEGFVASPAVLGNSVVIGAKNNTIYCFDADTGRMRWQAFAGSAVVCSSLVFPGRAVSITQAGILLVNDLATGKKLFSYDLGTPVKSSPAVSQNMLYITGMDGTVFVFGG